MTDEVTLREVPPVVAEVVSGGDPVTLIRRWMFTAEDESGDIHCLTEYEFIGTYADASKEANRLANKWEKKTGGLILRLELERRGRA